MKILLFSFVAIALAAALSGCTKKTSTGTEANKPLTAAELSERGKSIYVSNCTACHNIDPAKDGPIGPAVAGSSEALVEARVLRAEYPADYKPKRESRIMVALPHLKAEVPALAAYLSANGNAGQ